MKILVQKLELRTVCSQLLTFVDCQHFEDGDGGTDNKKIEIISTTDNLLCHKVIEQDFFTPGSDQ